MCQALIPTCSQSAPLPCIPSQQQSAADTHALPPSLTCSCQHILCSTHDLTSIDAFAFPLKPVPLLKALWCLGTRLLTLFLFLLPLLDTLLGTGPLSLQCMPLERSANLQESATHGTSRSSIVGALSTRIHQSNRRQTLQTLLVLPCSEGLGLGWSQYAPV